MATKINHTTLTANQENYVIVGKLNHKSVFLWYHAIRGALTQDGRILIQNNEAFPIPAAKGNQDDIGMWGESNPLAMKVDEDGVTLTIDVDNSSLNDIIFSWFIKPIKS